MTAEELLARRLRDHGVRRFFGIPGGPSIPYMEAFRKEGIEFILTSHEASAAVMADVTARLTGVTGVCHATFGPGATNLSTGVGGALLDRSPVLALTSELSDEWKGRTAQMNIDHQALFRPLTKATFRMSAADTAEIIDRSLAIANEEYPGPVHIGLPSGLAGRRVKERASYQAGRGLKGSAPVTAGQTGSFHTEERVKVLLASSRRPLIAAGLTAMRHETGRRLVEFLEQHQVPVVFTPMAGSLLPSSHPCYAGVLFHALSDRLKRLTDEADMVIGLGYDPVEYNYESWIPGVPIVHFDTRETDLQIRGAIQSVSPPDMWFEALSVLRSAPEMMALTTEVRQEILAGLRTAAQDFNPVTALTVLRDMLPRGTIVTADVGSHLHLLGQMWEIQPPGRLIMTNGWSSMGFGLPAALAASFVSRDSQKASFISRKGTAAALLNHSNPVVCITGDGGFLMHAGEIITARRYGLKVIVVVLSDGELNLIRVKQSWKGMSPYGTGLFTGPMFGSDNYLGTEVIRAANAGEMKSAVGKALLSARSVIIEAVVDPSVYSDLVVRS
ncbi:MAG: thiamine pyrophosphate-binding protein [Bacteroidales bacterium]